MFGYVNISRQSISEEDRDLFAAYYCGLCRAISEKSQLLRLGLNNDLTFLAVLLSGVCDEEPELCENSKCVVHAFKKHCEIKNNVVLDYASDMNILLVYFKICDDCEDEKSVSKKALRRLFGCKARKIIRKYPEISEKIQKNLKRLNALEEENCPLIDEAADCFAKLLEAVFVPDFISDEKARKTLEWMGYNLGRWIYIADAYEDLENDRKKNNYNPIALCGEKTPKEEIYATMTLTLSNLASAYDLLDIKRNDTLIRNIIYAGLPERQDMIFNKTEGNDGSLPGSGSQQGR